MSPARRHDSRGSRGQRAWRRWPIALVALLALPAAGAGTNDVLDMVWSQTRGAPGESAAGSGTASVAAGDEARDLARLRVVGARLDGLGAPPADVRAIGALGRATDIPEIALMAYTVAQDTLAVTDPECGLRWSLLAAIGRVESNHGRHGGARLLPSGDTTRPIRGLPLDGRPGVARISDTDRGALDGDPTFDRAVGPMQFIPSTWRVVAVDANGDGRRDPDNIFDAALAAGVYLCAGDTDLRDPAQLAAAVFRYNRSQSYVRLVLALAAAYERGRSLPLPPTGRLPTDIEPAPRLPLPPAHEGPPLAVPDERPLAPPATSGTRSGGGDGPGGAPPPRPSPSAPSPAPAPPATPDPQPPDPPEDPQPPPEEPQNPAPEPPDQPEDPEPPDDPKDPNPPEPPGNPPPAEEPNEPEEPKDPSRPEQPTPPHEPKDDPEGSVECAGEAAAGQPGGGASAAAAAADSTASGATPDQTPATVDATAPGDPACPPCPAAEGTPTDTGEDAPRGPGGPATEPAAPSPGPATGPRKGGDPPPEQCAASDPGAEDGDDARAAGPAPGRQASG
ncbi:MAG TPA: lytic murein transglycosylase [Acidimicrobiales bacterium]